MALSFSNHGTLLGLKSASLAECCGWRLFLEEVGRLGSGKCVLRWDTLQHLYLWS